jgi:hypothetical protein
MRKLLLATAAVMGGAMGLANAATFPPPAGTAPVPTPVPYTLLPSPTAGPGTITVRLDARIDFSAAFGSDSGRNPGLVTTAAGAAPVASNTKLSDYTFGEYARIFPGFDGIAGNGLKYGAAAEIRQDNGEPPGGGVNGSISASARNRNTLYWRRAYLYVGTDQAGIVRLGQGDGPFTLMLTGTFENFNDGAWDGDLPSLFTGNTQLVWPFPDVGNVYATTKAVYLSPSFYGFDFGVSFEPNTGVGTFTPGNCNYANTAASSAGVQGPIGGSGQGAGCDATSATSVVGETSRRRNTVEIGTRYRGAFGPVGVNVELAGMFSGKVENDAAPAVKATSTQYNNVALGDGGLVVTYGGLSVGGNIIGGAQNGQFALQPKGTNSSLAYTTGASYAFGPFVVGASYIDFMSAGNQVNKTSASYSPWVSGRNEWGISGGGTYNFAPGMNVFFNYLYGHRKEQGVDLLTGVSSTGTTAAGRVLTHNNVQAQGVMLGTAFRW